MSDLYPGLTASEKALAALHPADSLAAYKLSWKAETLCLTLYRSSETNDESDACRHFVWSALMTNSLGADFSSKVLQAHEADPKEPEAERAMDVFNNEVGIKSSIELKNKNRGGDAEILKEFKRLLDKKKLKVLKARGNK